MKISVIIPTYKEQGTIDRTLKAIKERSDVRNIAEILIVDATGEGGTERIANLHGARFLVSEIKSRGTQLRVGAKAACGGILYFLHADTIPPLRFDEQILHAVRSGGNAGCFQMRFDRSEIIFRVYGWFTRFHSIFFRGGDQSLFIRKEFYEQIGGFDPNYPIFEDIDIIERIRKVDSFNILPQRVITSARKYEINGFYRLQMLFAVLHMKYRSGAGPIELLRYYQKHVR